MSEENKKEDVENKDTTNQNADEVIELKKQIDSKKIQLGETEDRLKRIAAEFDNYKKRSSKERESMHSSLVADIVSGFLPVVDNLEKALEAKTDDENYKQGIELVLKQFKDVLKSNGVTEIEAVASVIEENLGEKEIKEEYRKGYQIGTKVIRHSMVVVAN